MLYVVIEAFKKSVMFLCTPLANRCWYTATELFEIILHSSSARLGGIHAVQIHLIGIHLIIAVSVIKRLRLHEFTPLWGRDLVSVVRIRESPYYRGVFFIENI